MTTTTTKMMMLMLSLGKQPKKNGINNKNCVRKETLLRGPKQHLKTNMYISI